MDPYMGKNKGRELEVQVVIPGNRPEIDLDGAELLRLELRQPGAWVLCTAGILWLTQQGDPDDHFLTTGQSFTLTRPGTVLVQGLPCGKACILRPGEEPSDQRNPCPYALA